MIEQKEALDKFSKIELLMLCDRLMDEAEIHRSANDIPELLEMSHICNGELESYPTQESMGGDKQQIIYS